MGTWTSNTAGWTSNALKNMSVLHDTITYAPTTGSFVPTTL